MSKTLLKKSLTLVSRQDKGCPLTIEVKGSTLTLQSLNRDRGIRVSIPWHQANPGFGPIWLSDSRFISKVIGTAKSAELVYDGGNRLQVGGTQVWVMDEPSTPLKWQEPQPCFHGVSYDALWRNKKALQDLNREPIERPSIWEAVPQGDGSIDFVLTDRVTLLALAGGGYGKGPKDLPCTPASWPLENPAGPGTLGWDTETVCFRFPVALGSRKDAPQADYTMVVPRSGLRFLTTAYMGLVNTPSEPGCRVKPGELVKMLEIALLYGKEASDKCPVVLDYSPLTGLTLTLSDDKIGEFWQRVPSTQVGLGAWQAVVNCKKLIALLKGKTGQVNISQRVVDRDDDTPYQALVVEADGAKQILGTLNDGAGTRPEQVHPDLHRREFPAANGVLTLPRSGRTIPIPARLREVMQGTAQLNREELKKLMAS